MIFDRQNFFFLWVRKDEAHICLFIYLSKHGGMQRSHCATFLPPSTNRIQDLSSGPWLDCAGIQRSRCRLARERYLAQEWDNLAVKRRTGTLGNTYRYSASVWGPVALPCGWLRLSVRVHASQQRLSVHSVELCKQWQEASAAVVTNDPVRKGLTCSYRQNGFSYRRPWFSSVPF